jgi:hypothetical protein
MGTSDRIVCRLCHAHLLMTFDIGRLEEFVLVEIKTPSYQTISLHGELCVFALMPCIGLCKDSAFCCCFVKAYEEDRNTESLRLATTVRFPLVEVARHEMRKRKD